MFSSGTKKSSTKFSEFFRSASSRDKKKLYADVLERATRRQNEEIETARLMQEREATAS